MKKEKDDTKEQVEDKGIESFDLSYFMDEDFYEGSFEHQEEAENLVSLLCFKLANEEYSIDIMSIKEIVKLKEFTEVPRAPDFVAGIISLRGVIVPVFDLRKRLGLEAKEYDRNTRIIIASDGKNNWGMIVDTVLHVIKLPDENIEPPPPIISGVSAEFISGIGKYEHKFVIIMNLNNVLDINI
jgi:purine-binding chemotaxis protein CheW